MLHLWFQYMYIYWILIPANYFSKISAKHFYYTYLGKYRIFNPKSRTLQYCGQKCLEWTLPGRYHGRQDHGQTPCGRRQLVHETDRWCNDCVCRGGGTWSSPKHYSPGKNVEWPQGWNKGTGATNYFSSKNTNSKEEKYGLLWELYISPLVKTLVSPLYGTSNTSN